MFWKILIFILIKLVFIFYVFNSSNILDYKVRLIVVMESYLSVFVLLLIILIIYN